MSADGPLEAARSSGLVLAGEPLLVLVSGGGDSVCLLDVALRLGATVSVLHVNYGLRPGAAEDEEFVRSLCAGREVPLLAERAELHGRPANVQELARDARYALAEGLAAGDYATAHTASDQAETVLYRLSTSPGSRALHGMQPRRGRLVRPLLRVTREEVRSYLRDRGLGWREDPSNEDRRFARSVVRHDVLPALMSLSPAAESNIADTARQLAEEAQVLDGLVVEAIAALGGGPAVSMAGLRELPAAVRRLVLRRLAGDRPVPEHVLELDERGSSSLDLGGGLRVVAEYGVLRFTRSGEIAVPEPVTLTVPGRVRFGTWEVSALRGSPGEVSVVALPDTVTVRAWREGDRMRPLGLGGSKSLQDLFTDRKIPRALRGSLPVVVAAGEIVWVAGVAVGEGFAAQAGDRETVGLSARVVGGPSP